MTSTRHVWRRGFGWAYCARCGVVRSLDRETPCRGALPLIVPRDGEQSQTSDEREIDRLRLEVARLRLERDQFERAIAALVAAADAGDREAQRHPSSRSSAPTVRYLGAMARLRAVLDQGAT